MSSLFQELEGETCILYSAGVFTECAVYTRNHSELFAKAGSGFIRLNTDGSTSKSKYRLDTLTIASLHKDPFGRLLTTAGRNTKPLTSQPKYLAYDKEPTNGND